MVVCQGQTNLREKLDEFEISWDLLEIYLCPFPCEKVPKMAQKGGILGFSPKRLIRSRNLNE